MKELFLQHFEKEKPAGSAWLQGLRRKALDRFLELGTPTTRLEDWRYTSVEPLNKIPFELTEQNGKGGVFENDFAQRSDFCREDDIRLVFVGDLFVPSLSSLKNLPKGVVVGNLATILKENPALLEKFLGKTAAYQDRSFVALNTAFAKDGAVLYFPKGVVVKEPIYLCHYSWTKGKPTVSFPRNLIVLEESAQATVVEISMGGGDETYLTNMVTEIVCGPNAVIDHYKLQHEGGNAFHLASTDFYQERESRVSSFSISLGAELSRGEVRTVLDAEGASCSLNGFYMVTGRQHVDNQTTIDHAKPHGTSDELYKGILSGQSRGVFNGKIIVRPGAEKTNSRQKNQNLLLSEEALINTKPLLEIFNNDVKCNHGATIGRLDENQVYYLRTRGIAETDARNLLTYAFASDLVKQIKIPNLQSAMEKWIFRRLMAGKLEDTRI